MKMHWTNSFKSTNLIIYAKRGEEFVELNFSYAVYLCLPEGAQKILTEEGFFEAEERIWYLPKKAYRIFRKKIPKEIELRER